MRIRKKYRPDYRAMYTDIPISDEVVDFLNKSGRKMEYMEYDLRNPRYHRNRCGQVIGIIPSREVSFERLIDKGIQLACPQPSPEEMFLAKEECAILHMAINQLEESERELIDALFFNGLTEPKYGKLIGCSRQNINKRKHRILCKLRKLIIYLDF